MFERKPDPCASCGSRDVWETIEDHRFHYGCANQALLEVRIPVVHCYACGFSIMDERAEKIMDDAIADHIARSRVGTSYEQEMKDAHDAACNKEPGNAPDHSDS